jgi:hypothetical protein
MGDGPAATRILLKVLSATEDVRDALVDFFRTRFLLD